MKNVQILLATYNGSKYIEKMLDSIIHQSADIIIHDDGSSDGTQGILKSYESKTDRVRVITGNPTGSAKNNFEFLMRESDADYLIFADQDDVWMADKVKKLCDAIKFYEKVYGDDFPLLIHSDLKVVDEQGKEVAESFWKYQNIDPKWGNKLNLMLTQNVVTGCAMIINRSLLRKAMPFPKEAIMHDWWLALVASSFGRVIYLEDQLVQYRQHGNNEVGAKRFDMEYILSKIKDKGSTKRESVKLYHQAKAFAEIYPNTTSSEVAKKFYSLMNKNKLSRLLDIFRYGFFKIGYIRNIGWLFL
jgi:glycosyltransferase involved in cell wall biosynthesis